ncbi:unnamed protein product, partial [Rotaria sp. Silwood1]
RKNWIYPNTQYLPTASIILVFYDEGWNVLLRTVHSVINTSSPELLKEVVFVDDASLQDPLDKYVKRWNGFVKLYRTEKHVGLIEARTTGAQKSMENKNLFLFWITNWLSPLLIRIALNRKALAVPILDGLEWKTLEHTNIYETQVPEQELKKENVHHESYWSSTHAGGLLVIDRQWFFELGAYGPSIRVWGAEQYELSFKVWQCGGIVEWIPCSHVAHAYRGPRGHPSYIPGIHVYQTSINHLRLAHVWMDEYVEYYYRREPAIRTLKYGDITERKKLRDKLQCRSFKWFMENIAYNAVWRLNEGSEITSGEHCFISDYDIIKKKFCLDDNGQWNPVGEWQSNKILLIGDSHLHHVQKPITTPCKSFETHIESIGDCTIDRLISLIKHENFNKLFFDQKHLIIMIEKLINLIQDKYSYLNTIGICTVPEHTKATIFYRIYGDNGEKSIPFKIIKLNFNLTIHLSNDGLHSNTIGMQHILNVLQTYANTLQIV